MKILKFLSRHKKNIFWTLGLIAVFMLGQSFQQKDMINGNLPIAKVTTLDGKVIKISDYKTPVIIRFWASWCSVCVLDESNVQYFSGHYPILNIASWSGNATKIRKYAEENNLPTDSIIEDENGTIAKMFGVKGTPSVFILNSQGKIAFKEAGYSTSFGLLWRLLLADTFLAD